MSPMPGIRRGLTALAAAALLGVLLLGSGACATAPKKPRKSSDPATALAQDYSELLRVHRPDLAARWSPPGSEEIQFEPLVAERVVAHERALRGLLDRANALPASERADTLRARLTLELEQTAAGGALYRSPLVWLEIVEAAARSPFLHDSTAGCREVDRAIPQLERIPEALRGAAVMMRGAPPLDPAAFEEAMARTEQVFRRELPARARACREGRLVAQFVEADSLAAASLAGFRRLLYPAP